MTQDYNQLARTILANIEEGATILGNTKEEYIAKELESVANTAKAETWDVAAAVITDTTLRITGVELDERGWRAYKEQVLIAITGRAAAIRKQREWTAQEILDREA